MHAPRFPPRSDVQQKFQQVQYLRLEKDVLLYTSAILCFTVWALGKPSLCGLWESLLLVDPGQAIHKTVNWKTI